MKRREVRSKFVTVIITRASAHDTEMCACDYIISVLMKEIPRGAHIQWKAGISIDSINDTSLNKYTKL